MLLPVLAARAAAVVMVVVAAFQVALVFGAPWGVLRGGETESASTHPGAWSPQSPARSARDGRCHPGTSPRGPLKGAPGKLVTALAWFTTIYAAVGVVLNLATRSSSERAVFAPTAILLFVLVVTVMIGSPRSVWDWTWFPDGPLVRAWLSWPGLAP